MTGLGAFLVDLTSRRETGESLAAFRIAIGLVLVVTVLSVIGPGMVDVLWVDAAYGGMRRLPVTPLVGWLGGARPEVIHPLVQGTLVGAICVTLGLGGRFAAFLTLQGYGALTGLNWTATGGYDGMLLNALWLLVLGNGSATWSLDALIREGRLSSERWVHAWPRYLIIFQLVVVYTATGWQKISAWWTPAGGYKALYWVLVEPTWRRGWDPSLAGFLDPLLRVATAVTWHWECLAPLLLYFLWLRRTAGRGGWLRRASNRLDLRTWWLAIGVVLHLGIIVLLDVGPFSFVSVAYYVTAFTPSEVAAWFPVAHRLFPRAGTG